ncbi:phosphate-starvation-inducible PsiE family protein [Terrisporobacter sp.]
MKKIINQKKVCMKLAHILEVILAFVVLIIVALGTVDTLRIVYDAYIVDFSNPVEYEQLNHILGQILMLVIGVELVTMLSLHKPIAVIEVLLYAIARKLLLIPKTSSMLDLLLGVVSIAGIFAIKKYLINKDENENSEKANLDVLFIDKQLKEVE